jgi:hypothetical protein
MAASSFHLHYLYLGYWFYLFHDHVPQQETGCWMHSHIDTDDDRTANRIFKK